MKLARELISKAKEFNGDLVKFQLYDHNKLYKDHPEIQNVELTFDQAEMLFNFGIEVGIEVFFSVFDVERVQWCEKIGVRRYKIGYSQNQNDALVNVVHQTGKEIFVSAGLNIAQYDNPRMLWAFSGAIIFLYCIAKYPTSLAELHLGKVDWRRCWGFSDHVIGIDAAKVALARGATIIEKHFAIDHETGVDAKWSMDANELKELKRWEDVVRRVL